MRFLSGDLLRRLKRRRIASRVGNLCNLELRDCAMKRSAGIAAPDAGSELKDPIGRAKPTLGKRSAAMPPRSRIYLKTPSPKAAVPQVFADPSPRTRGEGGGH